jgi:hypothetical protein
VAAVQLWLLLLLLLLLLVLGLQYSWDVSTAPAVAA